VTPYATGAKFGKRVFYVCRNPLMLESRLDS
jgi:hypothetical protein